MCNCNNSYSNNFVTLLTRNLVAIVLTWSQCISSRRFKYCIRITEIVIFWVGIEFVQLQVCIDCKQIVVVDTICSILSVHLRWNLQLLLSWLSNGNTSSLFVTYGHYCWQNGPGVEQSFVELLFTYFFGAPGVVPLYRYYTVWIITIERIDVEGLQSVVRQKLHTLSLLIIRSVLRIAHTINRVEW